MRLLRRWLPMVNGALCEHTILCTQQLLHARLAVKKARRAEEQEMLAGAHELCTFPSLSLQVVHIQEYCNAR